MKTFGYHQVCVFPFFEIIRFKDRSIPMHVYDMVHANKITILNWTLAVKMLTFCRNLTIKFYIFLHCVIGLLPCQ